MGFVLLLKAVLLFQLFLFAFSDDDIRAPSPFPLPSHRDSHALVGHRRGRSPIHPPAQPPPPPSLLFPRSFVAVQGVVYCKPCKYSGVDTLLGASPLSGATVKLHCKNTKYTLRVNATSDKNGYFFLEAPKTITTYGAHKCHVSLVSAPSSACSKITDLNGGLNGGVLRPERKYVSDDKLPYLLFTVGPFAFEPKCPR